MLAVLDAQRRLRDLSREALQATLDLQMSLADLGRFLERHCPSRRAQALRHVPNGPAKAGRYVLFFLLVAAVACGQKAGGEDETAEPAEVPTIVADVAKVTRRTVSDELVVRGTVAAVQNEDVKVSALVAGRVNVVSAAEGDTMREGQVIAELDRRPLEDQRRQAAAALDQAKAQVENARLNLQRNQQLFERGIAAAVVVFVPLGLLQGMVGQFFAALSLTLSGAVLLLTSAPSQPESEAESLPPIRRWV